MDPLTQSNHEYGRSTPQRKNDRSASSSRLGLPKLKASLAPAEVTLGQHPHDNNVNRSPTSPGSFHESIPRDYFHLHHNDMHFKSLESTVSNNEHYKYNTTTNNNHHHQGEGFPKIAEILQKTVDSPPGTPTSELSAATSPFSSTDSLASLVERQNQSKINHPGHQMFNSSRRFLSPTRKRSTASIFSVFNNSRNNSTVRSPLSEKRNPFNSYLSTTTSASSSSTRKLEPTASNPHHIHSSPEVRESNHVSLEYDPVSKRKVLNSYEIIKEIGRGEHGKVKLARDLIKDELVAIKIVDRKGRPKFGGSLSGGQTAEDKIRKEIAIMKKCRHPNVVKLKEVLDDSNSRKIYLVLEYLEKGEIKWRKSPGEPALTLPETLSALRDVVLGLEYLHYQGIIHRDIKPANLLVCADNSVKISDFGVSFAASLNGDPQNELDLCKSAGTPAFFAPELCQPITSNMKERPKLTHKIDVWALGVTLYCLLFGDLPFWGGNEFELFESINNQELKFPKEFPKNYEWAEEEIFQAKNLLNKMLEKDPIKRIGLKSIKRHPFVLRNLSVEEAKLFTGEQKSCESKIHVSNEEVKVAVTGIAGKIRKGFAKALKLAGLVPKRESHPPSLLKTSTSADLRPSLMEQKTRSQSYNLHDSSTKSLTFAEYELNKRNTHVQSPLATTESMSAGGVRNNRGGSRHHKRVKSGETSGLATRATVEGDLFLNKSSAFNALSGIMDDDRRRSSVVSVGGASSASETMPTTSNGSSLDNGVQLVSLPVNASFASLDSVYLDNYATSRSQSAHVVEPKVQEEAAVQEKSPRELFKKMNSFSLNRTTEKKVDDSVAPHEPSASFSLAGGDDNDDDEDEANDGDEDEDDADDDIADYSGGIERLNSTSSAARRMNSICTNVSQYSVPSYLANELQLSKSTTEDGTPDIVISSASRSETPMKPQRRPSLPKRGSTPKYSFFGGSSDDDDESDSSASSVPRRRRKSSTLISPSENESDKLDIIKHDSESEESSDSDGENDELTLVLGSRRSSRVNSVAVATLNRPSSEPKPKAEIETEFLSRVQRRSASGLRDSVSQIERVSSPLSKNAPKTPIANSGAHLLPHVSVNKNEYVNHYNKDHIMPPVTKTRYFGGVSLDEVLSDKQRSNSVTVGLLNQARPNSSSTNSETTSD